MEPSLIVRTLRIASPTDFAFWECICSLPYASCLSLCNMYLFGLLENFIYELQVATAWVCLYD